MPDKTIEELAIEERRKYQRAWNAKNKDKVAAKNRRYWAKKAAARLAAQQTAVAAPVEQPKEGESGAEN